jgi:two-component system, cell cycle sensor histidine kinase and response regulator CckA
VAEKPAYEELEQRVALLEKESAQRKRFEEINHALFKISNAVNLTSNLDELYKTIHLALSPVIDTTNFYIALYDKEKDGITFPYCIDSVDKCYPSIVGVSKTASLTAEVIRTGRPALVNKTEILTQRAKSSFTIPACTPSEIWLGVPLKTREEIIGVMAVQSYHDPRCYDQTDMEVMVSVADQVAIAVERKHAEMALQQAHDKLEHRVAMRTKELARVNEELRLDIAKRKLAEKELRESEKKFRLITENSADIISIMDMNLHFTYVSPAALRISGFTAEEIMSLPLERILTPESMRLALEVFEKELLLEASGAADPDRSRIIELEEYKKDGATVWMEASLSFLRDEALKPVEIIIVSRDVTERKRAEEEKFNLEIQLQQAHKFKSIGTLAGGVAHDFNNLLMGIQGHASLISLDLETSHPHREHIHAIEEYIRSATSLTQQLLGFARGGKYEIKLIDINELVQGSSTMFGRTNKEIRIHTRCQPSPLGVEADRGQIEQVLLNMYINAWQAMPPEGGELFLETNIVTMDLAHCKPHQTKPGRYVKVSIMDTGSGMDEATRLRIFDPFFSTKEKSRGTGLGLASAYGIIKNHGGMITVDSEIGRGTTFNIYLPVSDKEANREIPMEGMLIRGSETILLVDDEKLIINVGQSMLERLGYRVVVCMGGQEAVNVVTDIGTIIDMVILDLIMPEMDGSMTFDRIRMIQPGIPVLLSSGYSINGQAHEIMRRGCNGFIQKPYNISELSQKIRKVLDESKDPTR